MTAVASSRSDLRRGPCDVSLRTPHSADPPMVSSAGPFGRQRGIPPGHGPPGRDILTRIIFGTRVLGVAACALSVGGTIGTAWARRGLLRRLGGSAPDANRRRLPVPSGHPLALVLAVMVGPSFGIVVAVLGLVLWARFARLVRGETLSLKQQDFVALARIAGARGPHIVLGHILPNLAQPARAGHPPGRRRHPLRGLAHLSRAGIPPPPPDLGPMVAEGRKLIKTAWWISVLPGLAIMVVVFAYNFVGDWPRDRLDPRLRQV